MVLYLAVGCISKLTFYTPRSTAGLLKTSLHHAGRHSVRGKLLSHPLGGLCGLRGGSVRTRLKQVIR